MPNDDSLEQRLAQLERRLRKVLGALAVIGVALIAAFAHDLYLSHRLRRMTFTDGITVPSRFWGGAPFLNIATDGSSTGLTIGRLSDLAQVRLEQGAGSESHLVFYDQVGKARLRLGLAASGEPVLQTLSRSGAVTWSHLPSTP